MAIHNASFPNFTALYNQGLGIHFDTDNRDITVDSLKSSQNLMSAATVEASPGPVTFSDAKLCNSNRLGNAYEAGLNICDASDVTLINSGVYNNGTSQLLLTGSSGGRSVANYLTGVVTRIYNSHFSNSSNTIIATGSQQVFQDSWLSSDWGTFKASLSSNNNTWWNASDGDAFMLPVPAGHTELAFAQWKSATNQDSHSTFSAASVSCSTTPDAPDFWIVTNTLSNSAGPGSTTSFPYRVLSNNFGGTISLKADLSNIPGATASWSTASVSGSGTSTLSIRVGSSTPARTYPLTVIANSGNTTHTVTVSLVVR